MGWTNWTTLPSPYRVASNADGSVLFCVSGGTVHKSIDAGASWASFFTWPLAQGNCVDIDVSPDGQHIVIVGGYNGVTLNTSGIYVSHDYGSSFLNKTPGSNWNHVYCAISDDGQTIGVRSAYVSSPLTQSYFWYTSNGGANWTSRACGYSGGYVCDVSNDGQGLIHTYLLSSVVRVWASADGGSSWNSYDRPTASGDFKGVATNEDGTVFAACLNYAGANAFALSTDSGSSWTPSDGPWSGGRNGSIEMSRDGQRIVMEVYYGTANTCYIVETTDQGSSWDWHTPPANAQRQWNYIEINENPKLIYLTGGVGTAPLYATGYTYLAPLYLEVDPVDAQSSVDDAPLGNRAVFFAPESIDARSLLVSLAFDPPISVLPINVQSSLYPVILYDVQSEPLVVNRAPAPGAEKGVLESIRFSVRDADRQVRKTTIQCYLGYGSAWWGGGVLPEDDPLTTFILRSRVGAPSTPADRSLDGDVLVMTKSLIGLQESIYEFGGLQAPANYDAPLMFEFGVEMGAYVVDSQYWAGVFAGIKADNKGVAIKFVDDGNKKIELHSADPASATPIYTVMYDWSTGVHIFKLLWYPEFDVMRLYVSSGPTAVDSDVALIHGAISAFPDLPADEIPDVQPVGFFGHGGFNSTSTSRWSSAHLYNEVTQAIVNGIPRGNHDGNFLSDSPHLYAASDFPRKVTQPWVVLPDSFGTIGGDEILEADGRISLLRSDPSESFGFYRVEPKVAAGATIVDFKLWGRVASRPPGSSSESGIEVYVDDGTKKAVVEFLDTGDTQSVGLQGGSSDLSGWGSPALYRLIVDPTGSARIMTLTETDDGIMEAEFVGLNYASLPASDLPGPGIGFLHNANTVLATGELNLSWLRYSLDARMWEASVGLPLTPWSLFGTGTPTLANDIVTIVDDNDGGGSDNLGYSRAETESENKGLFIEAICAVDSYSKSGVDDPTRTVTGVGLAIDDDLVQYELLFADGGPELGKIAFLTTGTDKDQNLIDIRALRPEILGTYFAIDWAQFHHYRLERNIGGDIVVYVDWETIPRIQISTSEFEAIASTSEGVRFGSLLTDRKTTSRWQSVRYGISYGWDVEALPKVDELRYDNAVNALVEVDS